MSILTISQIYSAWVGVGGNTGQVGINMVAIAEAESGGNDHAISPTDDHGIWQINGIHASSFPNLWPLRYDAHASARMAKAISGNGINVGPWCTAWQNPAHCGSYLTTPVQYGSPAASHLAAVAAAIHSSASSDPAPVAGGLQPTRHPGEGGWSSWQHLLMSGGRAWDDHLQGAIGYLRRI